MGGKREIQREKLRVEEGGPKGDLYSAGGRRWHSLNLFEQNLLG